MLEQRMLSDVTRVMVDSNDRKNAVYHVYRNLVCAARAQNNLSCEIFHMMPV